MVELLIFQYFVPPSALYSWVLNTSQGGLLEGLSQGCRFYVLCIEYSVCYLVNTGLILGSHYG